MSKKFLFVVIITILLTASGCQTKAAFVLPEGFVYTNDVIPDALLDIRYYSAYNFVGRRIDGYHAPVSIFTKEAAEALKIASDLLAEQGYIIRIFDTYRPADAVSHFMRWADDPDDNRMKNIFYPEVNKENMIVEGYVTPRSSHSRGGAVDLTILCMLTGTELDMGSPFDFFGEVSHNGTDKITQDQLVNRLVLRSAMEEAGFEAYAYEWWHYGLINEPFPDTYFNFPVR